MKIAGFVKNSFVDYPENISAVVFTSGCNFNCWYCHNKWLIEGEIAKISPKEIFDFLKNRLGFLDGVVITGGEPTLQKDLIDFIKKIKKLNYKIKLDTNGTNPEILKKLLNEKLLDYVAMDLKTTLSKYDVLTGKKVDIKKIKQSIDLILNSEIDYEFRTTFVPGVEISDIEEMVKLIKGAKNYYLQKYNPQKDHVLTIPHTKSQILEVAEIAKKYVENVYIRGY